MTTVQDKQPRSVCPINYVVEIIGDRWSLLIIRDIVYLGKRTHGEFLRSDEGIATNILADRLLRLECQGIIKKKIDPKDKRREIFSLTSKGLGFIPFLIDLQLWSGSFAPSYIAPLSAPFVAALKEDREKVITQITRDVKRGRYVFGRKEWLPEGGINSMGVVMKD
jgi:DNA-binding HxlR family transcriptional regulator